MKPLQPNDVIPEQGQIVTVRQRRYVVADIQKNSLASPILALGAQEGHHLVTLNSIEDDGMGKPCRPSGK